MGILRGETFEPKVPSRALQKTGSGCFMEASCQIECQISKKE